MLDKRDISFAFALHILVVLAVIAWNQRLVTPILLPERTIQVNMVSLETLLAMLKPDVAPPPKAAPKPKVKPIAKLQPKQTLKKVRAREEELDYDPFAPMESSSNKPRKKKISGKQALEAMLSAQLSAQEIERYKLGMQRAVERQWKVPTEMIERVHDALVALILYRNGKVANIEIIESSGSAALDKTLIQAIYAAAPFVLPEQQFELFKENTIRFRPLK